MSQIPYFKVVFLESRQEFIGSIPTFRYIDGVDKDDMLTLTIDLDTVEDLDNEDFVEGKEVEFLFGLQEGVASKKRILELKDIKPRLGRGLIQVILVFYDKGHDMKKSSTVKVYKQKTSSEIAQEIADRYNLDADIDTTTKRWNEIPQANRDDFNILRYMAEREDNGEFIFYVRENTLHFHKRRIDQDSSVTYVYGNDDHVISFWPDYIDDTTYNDDSNSSYEGLDMEKLLSLSTGTTAEGSTGKQMGNVIISYNEDGVETGRTGGKVIAAVDDKQEAKNITASRQKRAALQKLTARLEVELDPNLEPDTVITMENASRRFSGNWYVTEVDHDVRGKKKARSLLRLAKDATDKAAQKDEIPATNINKSIGPNETSKSTELITYDGDGKQI